MGYESAELSTKQPSKLNVKIWVTALFSLTLLSGCGGGFNIAGADGPRGISFRPRSMTPEATFARYDRNFDTKLAPEEAQATCMTEAGIAFDQYDDDNDRFITFGELLNHPECSCGRDPEEVE